MTDTDTRVPSKTQARVLRFYAGRQVWTERTNAGAWGNAVKACKERGWVEETDDPPRYARTTTTGLAALERAAPPETVLPLDFVDTVDGTVVRCRKCKRTWHVSHHLTAIDHARAEH